jgi:hypothetical protein
MASSSPQGSFGHIDKKTSRNIGEKGRFVQQAGALPFVDFSKGGALDSHDRERWEERNSPPFSWARKVEAAL